MDGVVFEDGSGVTLERCAGGERWALTGKDAEGIVVEGMSLTAAQWRALWHFLRSSHVIGIQAGEIGGKPWGRLSCACGWQGEAFAPGDFEALAAAQDGSALHLSWRVR